MPTYRCEFHGTYDAISNLADRGQQASLIIPDGPRECPDEGCTDFTLSIFNGYADGLSPDKSMRAYAMFSQIMHRLSRVMGVQLLQLVPLSAAPLARDES